MALQGALMAARVNLFASILACRYGCLAVNGRVDLDLTAGAVQWLRANPPAGLAQTQVAERAALMLAA